MKGVEEIKSFLKSGKDFSASKDALPHPQVDREALIKVLMELHIENLALKANRPKVNGESPSVILAAGFTGESVAVGTPMNAAANSFVPSAGGMKARQICQRSRLGNLPQQPWLLLGSQRVRNCAV